MPSSQRLGRTFSRRAAVGIGLAASPLIIGASSALDGTVTLDDTIDR